MTDDFKKYRDAADKSMAELMDKVLMGHVVCFSGMERKPEPDSKLKRFGRWIAGIPATIADFCRYVMDYRRDRYACDDDWD